MQERRRLEAGFTLIEMLIVVAIIGLLMTFFATRLISRFGESKITVAEASIQRLTQAIEVYRLDNGRYPTTEQGLEALVREPTTAPAPRNYPPQGYATSKQILDPWETPYRYQSPGQVNTFGFDLCSSGPDGVPDDGRADSDDICNYEQGGRG